MHFSRDIGISGLESGHLILSIQGVFTRQLFNDGNITDIKAFGQARAGVFIELLAGG